MQRLFLFIILLGTSTFGSAQHTIKIKKKGQLQGFYQLQTEDKIKEFIYFDYNGNVSIISEKKRKKAKGNLYACVKNNSCQNVLKSTYTLNKLEITFSFNKGKGDSIYFIEYEGTLSSDALFLTLKKGETGKLVEVKEFRRLKS